MISLRNNIYNKNKDMYGGGPIANQEFRLNDPRGIAINNTGYVFVADTLNHCIRIFSPNPDYTLIHTIGSPDLSGATNRLFHNPTGIAIHRHNDIDILYIADTGNSRIQVFRITINVDNTITYLHIPSQPGSDNSIGTVVYGNQPNQFYSPQDIKIHSDILYVADTGNHRIQMFRITINANNTITSIHIPSQIGSPHSVGMGLLGSTNSTFNGPRGIAIHQHNDEHILYVADTENNRIQVFRITINGNNTVIALHLPGQPNSPHSIGMGLVGNTNSRFRCPYGVTIHRQNDQDILYVADTYNHRIQMFRININNVNNTITATHIPGPNAVPHSLGTGHFGRTDNTFFFPRKLAIHNDLLYILDVCNNRIQLFNGDLSNATTIQYYGTIPHPPSRYTILNHNHSIPYPIRNTACLLCNFNICTPAPQNIYNNINGYIIRLDIEPIKYFHYTCIYNYITSHNLVDTYQIGVNRYDTIRLIENSHNNNNFEGTDFFIPDFIILQRETDVPQNSRDTPCRLCGYMLCTNITGTTNNVNGYVVHLNSLTNPNTFYYHYKCISRYFIQIMLSVNPYKSPHCATIMDKTDIDMLLNIDIKAYAISGNGFY